MPGCVMILMAVVHYFGWSGIAASVSRAEWKGYWHLPVILIISSLSVFLSVAVRIISRHILKKVRWLICYVIFFCHVLLEKNCLSQRNCLETEKRDMYEMHKYWGKKPSCNLGKLVREYSNLQAIRYSIHFLVTGFFCCEAYILGRNVISNDLNPAANFINTQLFEKEVDLEKVQRQWLKIKEEFFPFCKPVVWMGLWWRKGYSGFCFA